ncbi:MAG: cytidine deaminase [Lactobacillales bacterium]|nr:cytidine deaminase [Lactobacillales bacterium]
MDIGKKMFKIAVDFLNERYGGKSGGVAVLRTKTGAYLISVWPEVNNASVELCAETGAICEAHKLNQKITHSLCVCRQQDGGAYEILTPCGVCQERLYFWGRDVQAAISTKKNAVVFKKLSEIQPYYFRDKH